MFEFLLLIVVAIFVVRFLQRPSVPRSIAEILSSFPVEPPTLLSSAVDLDEIRRLKWWQFEKLIVQAYQRQGYVTEWRGGGRRRPDGGVDILARGHGETVVVQCKHWRADSKVSVKAVRELGGVLKENKADRGIFITTAGYTDDALRYARNNPEIVLIDGPMLVHLLAGVRGEPFPGAGNSATAQPPQSVPLPEVGATPQILRYAPAPSPVPNQEQAGVWRKPGDVWDPDAPHCPQCNDKMVLRTAKRGGDIGQQFWGCARYPRCAGTRKIYAESSSVEQQKSEQKPYSQRRRRQ